MIPHSEDSQTRPPSPPLSGGGNPTGYFVLAIIITIALAWYFQTTGTHSQVKGPAPALKSEAVNYVYIDTNARMNSIRINVAPTDEASRKALLENLKGCYVFFSRILPMSPEDSVLLYKVKPYTDKDNIITDKGLESREGMVSKVRVLLENTFQSLRTAGQFKIIVKNPPQKIALGQEFAIALGAEGCEPKEIANIETSAGTVTRSADGKVWTWKGTLSTPGPVAIKIWGHDKRNAGPKSRYDTTITIVATPPLARQKPPIGAFAGELFTMDLAVDGLDDIASYSYKILIGGQVAQEGKDATVNFRIPENALGKSFELQAEYKGAPYSMQQAVANSSPRASTFTYNIVEPPDRIICNIKSDGEYQANQLFEFTAVRCGICKSENRSAIPNSMLDVSLDSPAPNLEIEIDDKSAIPNTSTGKQAATLVRFRITGKIPKDGTEVTLHLKAGSARKDVRIILSP